MASRAEWRPMREGDLQGLLAVQEEAYPWHQEAPAVFRNRLAIYPEGCLTLDDGAGVAGYAISHPWAASSPPSLDTLLDALPAQPGTYYLHDVALFRRAHGHGHATAAAEMLARRAAANGFASLSLVAVNGSAPFWARRGFVPAMTPDLATKLATYGADAIFMTRAPAPEEDPPSACPPPPA